MIRYKSADGSRKHPLFFSNGYSSSTFLPGHKPCFCKHEFSCKLMGYWTCGFTRRMGWGQDNSSSTLSLEAEQYLETVRGLRWEASCTIYLRTIIIIRPVQQALWDLDKNQTQDKTDLCWYSKTWLEETGLAAVRFYLHQLLRNRKPNRTVHFIRQETYTEHNYLGF